MPSGVKRADFSFDSCDNYYDAFFEGVKKESPKNAPSGLQGELRKQLEAQ